MEQDEMSIFAVLSFIREGVGGGVVTVLISLMCIQ